MARGVASGMTYLSDLGFIHRVKLRFCLKNYLQCLQLNFKIFLGPGFSRKDPLNSCFFVLFFLLFFFLILSLVFPLNNLKRKIILLFIFHHKILVLKLWVKMLLANQFADSLKCNILRTRWSLRSRYFFCM